MLWDKYDALILDLDGVVYIGDAAVPHAIDSLNAVADRVFLTAATNNAARTAATVGAHLRQLGLQIGDDDVVTSADAGARLMADCLPAGEEVLAVGGQGVSAALASAGFVPLRAGHDWAAMPELLERAQGVLQGHGTESVWWDWAAACLVIGQEKPWIATNRDTTVPTALGFGPGNGAFVSALEVATGRSPAVAGKPQPTLFEETARRVGARNPLVIGDRLDTDIDGAIACGFDSLLVFTGVHGADDVLARPADRRPTYLAADLRALVNELPPVR